jgi:hypothetical protein
MRIENELKLGFKDVMIRPKRSTLISRSQVTLEREFKFLHSSVIWTGILIIFVMLRIILASKKENYSKLKELTKRTTFIRVQEQENQVYN